jgi:protein-S-isoprenylcysteine O-methyltransferase Ste14
VAATGTLEAGSLDFAIVGGMELVTILNHLVVGVSFGLYALGHQNITAELANDLSVRLHANADILARLLFCFAAALLAVAALIRTWASSYLHATVVYAAHIKTAALVADGPYRHVRNPLYLANVLMAVGMGSMMSRSGFIIAGTAMLLFCYRLILREEADLRTSRTVQYDDYHAAVPRPWPALQSRVPSSGNKAKWGEGFKAECWYWGFPVAVTAFALTLNMNIFFGAMAVAILVFWVSSNALARVK